MAVDEHSIERLILDNEPFEQLASALDIFCPFEAVGMSGQEIRHGYFLRYILDPQRPHGFGAECLRGLMWAAASALRDDPSSAIRPLDVHLMDFESAVVEREFQSIDLLIKVPATKVVVAIELKIDATEHSGQLGRYRRIIEKEFPKTEGWRAIFLFVTKRGDLPSLDDGEEWQPLPLDAVAAMLDRVHERGSGLPEARLMLDAYVKMLRRNHLTDPRLENLARDLWQEHREVLDFLMARKPDVASDVLALMIESQAELARAFGEAMGWEMVPDHSTKTYVRFAVKNWDDSPGMLTGTGWKPSNRMMLFEFWRDNKNSIRCQFVLGPGETTSREAVFNGLKDAGADVGGNWPLTAKWRTLASRTLVTPKQGDTSRDVFDVLTALGTEFLQIHGPTYDRVMKTLTA